MTANRYDVVIVGAGHAGAQAAIALRQAKFAGTILIIGAEPDLPYERPPLSKDYLSGDKPFDRLLVRPQHFWTDRQIDFRLGEIVTAIDPEQHRVRTDHRSEVNYGHLIWAAGGEPRRLTCSGHALRGVHAIRTRADVDRLIADLPAARAAVVIGGGYIGLEAAAVLTKIGTSVTLVEALDRVLARVAGEAISRFYEAEHRAHGVEVLLGTAIECITGDDVVTGVRLSDGRHLPADIVIVGIGILPSVTPLAAAGAEVDNGVLVDSRCRTSLPGIFAIGDCAAHVNHFAGGNRIRLESVQNANDQAAVAAKTIAGVPTVYDAVPWFWSNQYDLKMQTVGLSLGHDDTVVRGDPADRSFAVFYLRQGRVIAVDAINAVKAYVQGRNLVAKSVLAPREALADPAVPLIF